MRLNSIKRNALLRWGAGRLSALSGALCIALGFSSCESIFDADPNCRLGVALNFVYEYHMEPGANAFPSNVDCVEVFVFDADGNYVRSFSETSDALRDVNYRMEIPLEAGDYHFLVYGGLTCEHPRFEFKPGWTPETRAVIEGCNHALAAWDDVRVTLPLEEDGASRTELHDIEARTGGLFYGTLDVTLTEEDLDVNLKPMTVYLMKDTNTIQVILQELNYPNQIDVDNYRFRIVDDNFVLDGHNKALSIATADFQPRYEPYVTKNRVMGYVAPSDKNGEKVEEDAEREVQVACAEFSTSRLFLEHIATAKLIVTNKNVTDNQGNEQVLIDIPLIRYLAETLTYGDSRWIARDRDLRDPELYQEFLDRQSRWTLMFFLQHDVWVNALVAVNWWTVRINDIDFS